MEPAIAEQLTDTFKSVFGRQDIQLSRATTAQDIQGWDSLTHMDLIVAVERKFKIRFTTHEVMSLSNVGDLADTIARKLR